MNGRSRSVPGRRAELQGPAAGKATTVLKARKLAGCGQVRCSVRKHVADRRPERLHGSNRDQCDQYHEQRVFRQILAFLFLPQPLNNRHLWNLLYAGVGAARPRSLTPLRLQEATPRSMGYSYHQPLQRTTINGGDNQLILPRRTRRNCWPPPREMKLSLISSAK